MTISERERHLLHEKLDELMGPEAADIAMRHLPPVGWADVATKHDLAELEGRLTDRFEAMITREFSGLDRRMSEMELGLHGETAGSRGEMGGLRGDLADLRGQVSDLRAEMHSELRAMGRTYVLGNVALVVAVAGFAFGVAQLG